MEVEALGVDAQGRRGSTPPRPARVYSSSIAPQYEKQNNKTRIYHSEDIACSPLARLYTSLPALMRAGVEIIYFICTVKKKKQKTKQKAHTHTHTASSSFHFPHKSGIPLPVKVGRLSADSGVPGDRKRETEVPLGKPFNATIYTAGRAGS